MVLHCVIFKFSWLPLTLHSGYQKKINRHLTELNETKQTQEGDLPRWHFPSGHFTNNGTLPCHYFMEEPGNLRVKDFASEDLPSIWSQDKQHVAQYLGKFCFVHMKRISYSEDSLNTLLLLWRVEMVKKWAFQIVSSVPKSSMYMFWFRNLENEAKKIKVLLLVWINREKLHFNITGWISQSSCEWVLGLCEMEFWTITGGRGRLFSPID